MRMELLLSVGGGGSVRIGMLHYDIMDIKNYI